MLDFIEVGEDSERQASRPGSFAGGKRKLRSDFGLDISPGRCRASRASAHGEFHFRRSAVGSDIVSSGSACVVADNSALN